MYAYNPGKKSYRQLEHSMVGSDRWDILNSILEEMDIKKEEGPKQHWMILGPRGIGKSHLMTLLYHKVKDNRDLKKKWIPVLFPEDLRRVGNLYTFLERAVNEIILEFDHREDTISIANELKQKIKQVKASPVSARADNFFSLISWFHDETGKHILLITENMQKLLGKKFSLIEQKKLRAFLQTSNALLIIGSAATVFDALHDHSHPFFHFFHIRRLADLDFEDMRTLILDILTQKQQPELSKKVTNGDAKLKVLYSFTGGNPRIAVFLADILSTEVPEEMSELMDSILDELTPYFESILNGIPDCLEEVINTLAVYEPAQSPGEIAEHLEAPQSSIRNYLKQLKENGFVRIAFSKGKSNYYCLNEYLYRIWFQMRDSSHREETRWLMELLLILYSRETISEEKALASRQPLERKDDKENALMAYLMHIKSRYESLAGDFDSREIYNRHIVPLLKESSPGIYVKQLYGTKKSGLSVPLLYILLTLHAKYDIVSEHIQDIMGYLKKEGKERKEFDLLIFTIRLSIWMKLIDENLNDALKLIELYIEYIKALRTGNEKESDVLNFSLDLFNIQIKYHIKAENVHVVLKRMEDEEGVPFSDVIFKGWTCLSEPDSVEARRFLNEKPIAALINEIKEKASSKEENEVDRKAKILYSIV